MSVRKRRDTGRWQARYTGVDGNVYAKDFDLKSDAQKWEREQKRRVEGGSWLPTSRGKSTVGDAYESWIKTRVDVKQQTREGYERVWNSYLSERWGILD